jgi:hypothetical protein
MKHILLAVFIINSIPAIAQPSVTPPLLQHMEVSKLMADVCGIDEDSRQCELMQFLAAKSSGAASEGNFLGMDPKTPPGFIEYITSKAASEKERVGRMEMEGKMQPTRMYRIFDKAKDRICGVKVESEPCVKVLMYFAYQAEVETGLKLNYPANIPVHVKKSIRERISKEHPDLNRSSRLLVEAIAFLEVQKMQEIGKIAPNPTEEESGRKRKGICAHKYSPSFDPQKCR